MTKQFKSSLPVLLVFLSILFIPSNIVNASPVPENNSGAVLCPPDAYVQDPYDCSALGPSEYLTQMAKLGIVMPLRPLQISHPDPSLGELPYHYYRINATGTKFYPTLEEAISKHGATQILAPGAFFYIVYTQRIDTQRGSYFQLPSGLYMPGDGSTVTISTPMPGVEVHSTPPNPFGFVFNQTPIRQQPNEMAFNTPIGLLKPYDIVQVYSTENIEGTIWLMIGPNEWILGRDVGVVTPAVTPPDGVANGRWIDVNLDQQTLAVYENSTMVYATIIATGAEPLYTKPGLFKIYKRLELETMQGERGTPNFYYLENVPWTMYFDKARALHGAYWRARLGYPQSHGCVNLYPGDAHWLFDWASMGDWVYVHDPSGKTPTDPALYGDGGA